MISKVHKVLLVEDDEILLENLHDIFQSAGFEVILARNGKEGLASAFDSRPDVIILDILMPLMDGLTMMKNLRRDEWGKKVPIIILTNLNPDDAALDAIVKDYPAYYLIKSNLNIDEVVERTKEVLKEHGENKKN